MFLLPLLLPLLCCRSTFLILICHCLLAAVLCRPFLINSKRLAMRRCMRAGSRRRRSKHPAEGGEGQAVGEMCRLGTGQTKMKDTHFRLTCCGMLCTCIWLSSMDGPLCGRVCGSCTNIKANRKNTNIAAYFWAPKHKCDTNQAELSPAKWVERAASTATAAATGYCGFC